MRSTSVVAVGRLPSGGPWVGFATDGDESRLVFGQPDGLLRISAARGARRARELLAVMMAYYEESLEAAPPELEATQADLAGVLRRLRDAAADPLSRSRLGDALDAIDDGLAGDAVLARLSDAWRTSAEGGSDDQPDVVGALAGRYRELGTGSAANGAAPSV